MEHFSAVQSIIRAGLNGDAKAVDKQVRRLQSRLRKAGSEKEVDVLERLLHAASEAKELAPSRVEVSRSLVTGEELSRDANPPIDRETGAALCEITFPNGETVTPVYGATVGDAVEGMIEEWQSAALLSSMDVEPTKSVLIYGPPGSGKTLTAHYVANRLGLPLLTARIDGLISSFLGTTARNIAGLFSFANRYRCVLLLDEFDALAKLRDDPQEIGEIKRVVNTLLQNLDERRRHGITIAITNHDRLLDPAVWRRFESQIHIDAPHSDAREHMIARFLKPVPASPATIKLFAYCLAGLSGADLERVCTAVKRTLALNKSPQDAASVFDALVRVLSKAPHLENQAAWMLTEDLEAFVSLAANDHDLRLKQTEIGEATGFGQSKVSEIKQKKRHLEVAERFVAQ